MKAYNFQLTIYIAFVSSEYITYTQNIYQQAKSIKHQISPPSGQYYFNSWIMNTSPLRAPIDFGLLSYGLLNRCHEIFPHFYITIISCIVLAIRRSKSRQAILGIPTFCSCNFSTVIKVCISIWYRTLNLSPSVQLYRTQLKK